MKNFLELLYPHMSLVGIEYRNFYGNCTSHSAYVNMLQQTFFYVKETVPMLESVLHVSANHPLFGAIKKNASEEINHDEMLLEDIKLIGIEPLHEPFEPVSQIVSLCKGVANTPDPISTLYGHIAIFDCHPRTKEQIDNLISIFQVPKEAASCYYIHAELDIEHREDAINALNHSTIDQYIVLERAILLSRHLRELWRELYNRFN